MRETLVDVVQHISPLFQKAKIITDDNGSRLSAHTDDKNFLVTCKFKTVLSGLMGEFGVGDLGVLKGLLEFPPYKSENSKLLVKKTTVNDIEFISEFEFRDEKGGRSKYKTMNGTAAGDNVNVANIPWELSFTPDKSKVAEIAKLSGLFSEVHFALKVDDGKLFLTIGSQNEKNSHSATIFVIDCDDENVAKLVNSSTPMYNLAQFISILRHAGSEQCSVHFSSRGVIGISVDTPKCSYMFYIRGKYI
jgi:hypothetical protein